MNRFSIQIPEPCAESWETMQPDGCGRFCANCQKTVVDYSNFSDAQLIQAFRDHTATLSLCGRFRPEQLQRSIKASPHTTSRWSRWVNVMTISLLGWQTAQAQTRPKYNPSVQDSLRPKPTVIEPIVSNFKENRPSEITTHWTVSGRVLLEDSTGNQTPVSQANILVGNQRYSWTTQTDSTGAFLLEFDATQDTTEFRLFISSRSGLFKRSTFTGNPANPVISLGTIMVHESKAGPIMVGGGICIVRKPSLLKRLWRSIF
ncbi:carboxypeptidase-like regulatory domain-containing protein [Spirosoma daeguense]